MFNCYRVFLGNELFAVVRTETAAHNLIALYTQLRHPTPEMHYQPAYIPEVGF